MNHSRYRYRNRTVVGVSFGDMPGQVSMRPLAGTRTACPEPQSPVDARLLEQLGGAWIFGFRRGRLAISYAKRYGSRNTMLYDARTLSKAP